MVQLPTLDISPFSLGKKITIFSPSKDSKSGYDICQALFSNDLELSGLIQQYGGLVQVTIDPSSGLPAPETTSISGSVVSSSSPVLQLYGYQVRVSMARSDYQKLEL